MVLRDSAAQLIEEFGREAGRIPTGVVLRLPEEPAFLLLGCANAARSIRDALAAIGPTQWSEAADPREALVRIGDTTCDVLFLDATDARALELCRVLKAHPLSATIAVVAVGGESDAHQDAIDAGCDHWVPLPLPGAELYSRVLHLLRTRALFQSLVDAHEQNRRRRDWVRYLVHDLRNGLSSIISNFEYVAETMGERSDSDDTIAAIKEASFSARRMAALLQDMLDVDRFKRNELRPRPTPLDLGQLVTQAAADVRLIARVRDIRLQVAAPSCELDADRSLIERVLANLLGNAVRYARSFIRIGIELGDSEVRVVVANDGPPIPHDARERIFVPFMQLDGGSGGGAGLGLAFCRLALEAHGGSIALGDGDSEVAFVVRLPRRTAVR